MKIIILCLLLIVGCNYKEQFCDDPPIVKRPIWIEVPANDVLVTMSGIIFVPPHLYEHYTKNPTIPAQAVLVHEKTHAKRQCDNGFSKWHLMYAADLKYRWNEERIAYEAEIRFLKEHKYTINKQHYFDAVTNEKLYGKMVSKEEAQRWIDNLK